MCIIVPVLFKLLDFLKYAFIFSIYTPTPTTRMTLLIVFLLSNNNWLIFSKKQSQASFDYYESRIHADY